MITCAWLFWPMFSSDIEPPEVLILRCVRCCDVKTLLPKFFRRSDAIEHDAANGVPLALYDPLQAYDNPGYSEILKDPN